MAPKKPDRSPSRSSAKPVVPDTSGATPRQTQPSGQDADAVGGAAYLFSRFERYAWDIAGLFCLTLSAMTLVALFTPEYTSGLLAVWGDTLRLWFGWGSIWVVFLTGVLGAWIIRHRGDNRLDEASAEHKHGGAFWARMIYLEVAAFASLALLAVIGGRLIERAEAGQDGGRVGWGLAELLYTLLAPFGLGGRAWLGLLLGLLFLLTLVAGLGLSRRLAAWLSRPAPHIERHSEAGADLGISEAPLHPEPPAAAAAAARKRTISLPPQFRKNFRLRPDEPEPPATPAPRDERLPPLDLLVYEQYSRPDERTINQLAGLIEKTLSEFGIPARVIDFRVGPTVTQFAVEPGYLEKEKTSSEGDLNRQKVRVAQISSLARDLALALSAERLRIEAPVPGRPYVGIEVPNPRASVVRLRPVMESETFRKVNPPLAVALGRDVSGQPVVADLSRMPHLLIAGTTGSGKSVCIAALTTCLVINNTPEDLRLVMVDPKMVELVRFNGLPHLYGKVETDVERILAVLRWTVAEMDRRYKVLEATHSRNIDSYNKKVRRRRGEATMPRIVVMIDELADLMMSAPDQTEHNLVRLAQMARATGIHLVVATQRPGTEVVTGLIKANFPARISFAVASSIDSRVILDTGGAEALLGRGDMLFLPPDASGTQRLQGVMVSDQEVERVITFWQKSLPRPETPVPSPWEEMLAQEEVLADRDGLVERAIEIVRQEQRASASMLQRRLRIGYPRAARLVDELEELGVIGPAVGGGREREVLIDREPAEDA
jgi:DNA segregation ATPase FtsK/SpoIIIE, S-DNA-T family